MPSEFFSYLRNREVSGVLNVARLFIQLREGGIHALVLTAGLAVLLWSWLLRGGAPLGLTVHRRREHLQDKLNDFTQGYARNSTFSKVTIYALWKEI